MRISALSINLKSTNVINNTSNRYDSLLTQLSSGQKISKGSEDPILAQKSIYLNNLKTQNTQYSKNTTDAKSIIDYSESVLGQAGDIISRAKELTMQSATDTINNESREAIVKEFNQLIIELTNLGNQQFNGKYIFAGTNTTTKPFELVGDPFTGVNYNGNLEKISFNISENAQLISNVTGDAVFLDTINELINVRDLIAAGDVSDIGNIGLNLIENGVDRIINARTELGAKSNIAESNINRIHNLNIEIETSLSSLIGVNIAEKQVELAGVEVSYQASLSVVSKMHSMSILDYLR